MVQYLHFRILEFPLNYRLPPRIPASFAERPKFVSTNFSIDEHIVLSNLVQSDPIWSTDLSIHQFIYVCLLWIADSLEFRCCRWFQVVDAQKTRCFGIAPFCRTSAVGVLEPKDQRFCCPLTGGQTTMYMGNVYCVQTVSPFAPPTHDWFHQSRAGESF